MLGWSFIRQGFPTNLLSSLIFPVPCVEELLYRTTSWSLSSYHWHGPWANPLRKQYQSLPWSSTVLPYSTSRRPPHHPGSITHPTFLRKHLLHPVPPSPARVPFLLYLAPMTLSTPPCDHFVLVSRITVVPVSHPLISYYHQVLYIPRKEKNLLLLYILHLNILSYSLSSWCSMPWLQSVVHGLAASALLTLD